MDCALVTFGRGRVVVGGAVVGGAAVGGVTGFVVGGGLVGGGAVAAGVEGCVGAGAAGEPPPPAGRVVALAAGIVVVLEELGVVVAVVVEEDAADPMSLASDPQPVASTIAPSRLQIRIIGDVAPCDRRCGPPAGNFTSCVPATSYERRPFRFRTPWRRRCGAARRALREVDTRDANHCHHRIRVWHGCGNQSPHRTGG